jgi:SEC-C motif-containing protein
MSGKNFDVCCSPYLSNDEIPKTPLELMRSRYTAFTKGDTRYLKETMKKRALELFDEPSTKEFAMNVKWKGLTIISAPTPQNTVGYVEFIASYQDQESLKTIHELSTFEKIGNRWFYTEGKHFEND